MLTERNMHTYVQDLEQHLQSALFAARAPDPVGAVLLVRCALADGDRNKATQLADATQRLAVSSGEDGDMAAAAEHARGLSTQDPLALERAADRYSADLARAGALEDAGNAWARRGNHGDAEARLREAHALYEGLGAADNMARVRSGLRAVGTRLRHWDHADRPAYGWGSLTDTERRIADLVAQGLSNREVAGQIFLSTHTVAYHLRHIFWKLGVTSRVQLGRMVAEQDARDTGEDAPTSG